MHKLVDYYLLYRPKIKYLLTGQIVTITTDKEEGNLKNFIHLSSFLHIRDEVEYKILLRTPYSFSKEEIKEMGVQIKCKDNTHKARFIIPEDYNIVDMAKTYKKCFEKHADIFGLINLDIAEKLN